MKKWNYFLFAVIFIALVLLQYQPALAKRGGSGGRGGGPVIYVTSQQLFYDSIVTADPLPPNGPFQQLFMSGPSGLETVYGPGDPGYVGGRWWIDLNGNNEMDMEDKYFLCPLLGPGRPNMW